MSTKVVVAEGQEIHYNGEVYEAGDEFEVTKESEADSLIELGSVVDPNAETPEEPSEEEETE